MFHILVYKMHIGIFEKLFCKMMAFDTGRDGGYLIVEYTGCG